MAMNSDILGMVWAQRVIDASSVPPTPAMIVNIQKFWKGMAADIVQHIQTSAVVSTEVVVKPGIPVSTTGTPAAQSGSTTAAGSGTGTGTIS